MICLTALLVALLLVSVFFLPHHQRTSAKRLPDLYQTQVPQFHSAVDKDGDGIDDQMDILQGALAYVSTQPQYKSKYYSTGYPNDGYGVCTDVVTFAMRGAGYDLIANEAMQFVSDSRIEKYESGKSPVQPEEVLAMEKAYKKPGLCNYYCSHECPIGQEYVPEVKINDLANIVLKTLASMNSLDKAKDRFIEITADGEISEDELADFVKIQDGIEEISMAAESLSLWVSSMAASGKIDEEKLEEVRKALKK